MDKKNLYLMRRIFPSGILGLNLFVFPTISHSSNGEDLVKAASVGNLSKVRALL